MLILKRVSLLIVMGMLTACAGEKDPPICGTKESCLNDPHCECWCSKICGFRKKETSDHPVYIENDPHGKFCYCKQWDADHYEANCVLGEHVEEPKNAK